MMDNELFENETFLNIKEESNLSDDEIKNILLEIKVNSVTKDNTITDIDKDFLDKLQFIDFGKLGKCLSYTNTEDRVYLYSFNNKSIIDVDKLELNMNYEYRGAYCFDNELDFVCCVWGNIENDDKIKLLKNATVDDLENHLNSDIPCIIKLTDNLRIVGTVKETDNGTEFIIDDNKMIFTEII